MSKLPWHGPLFPVKGLLAERYALTLKHIAKLDCPLQEFSIDRLGWSPQLAAKLGDDYLETYVQKVFSVTPEQVQQMASKYILSDKLTIVLVGDKAKIADQIAPYQNSNAGGN